MTWSLYCESEEKLWPYHAPECCVGNYQENPVNPNDPADGAAAAGDTPDTNNLMFSKYRGTSENLRKLKVGKPTRTVFAYICDLPIVETPVYYLLTVQLNCLGITYIVADFF